MAASTQGTRQTPPLSAVDQSCSLIEKVLGVGAHSRKSDKGLYVDRGLYVVKQGSSYVIISVFPSGKAGTHALVRVVARVVSGVRPEPSLFRQLLILNSTLRFGAFAYDPNGEVILFAHTLLGGSTLDVNELQATVHDVALVADAYDDRIVARYGGQRMQDVVEENALAHLLNPEGAEADLPTKEEDLPADFVTEHTETPKRIRPSRSARAPEPAAAEAPAAEEAPATTKAPGRARPKSGSQSPKKRS